MINWPTGTQSLLCFCAAALSLKFMLVQIAPKFFFKLFCSTSKPDMFRSTFSESVFLPMIHYFAIVSKLW